MNMDQVLDDTDASLSVGEFYNQDLSSQHQQQWQYLLGYPQRSMVSCIDNLQG